MSALSGFLGLLESVQGVSMVVRSLLTAPGLNDLAVADASVQASIHGAAPVQCAGSERAKGLYR